MKRALVLACVLIALVVVCASVATAGGDAAKGKALYATKCASCHGADGTPKEMIAKAMKVEMKHLGSKEIQSKKDEELKKEATEGVGKMKAVKLTDEEAANIIAFVRTLKK